MDLSADQQRATLAYFGAVASKSLIDLGGQVGDYIQRGPTGVSWLCFLGGVLNIVYNAGTIIDIFDVLLEPLGYLVTIYQLMFGLGTCIIEAPQEWVLRSNNLAKVQKFVHDHAKFLTTFGGRGLFYLFQGSLLMSLDGMVLSISLGCYMFMLGAISIAMQYGFMASDTGPVDIKDNYIHVAG